MSSKHHFIQKNHQAWNGRKPVQLREPQRQGTPSTTLPAANADAEEGEEGEEEQDVIPYAKVSSSMGSMSLAANKQSRAGGLLTTFKVCSGADPLGGCF